MTKKYHINDNGEVRPCDAKIKCDFGGNTGTENHFTSKAEAVKFAEKKMEEKYPFKTVGKTNSNFESTKKNIKEALKFSGIIKSGSALPPVRNKKEMIDKWFAGDKKKFDVISRIANPKTSLKDSTRKSMGDFVSSGVEVSINKDSKFDKAPNALHSTVELLDENMSNDKISMADLASGKLKAF